MSTGGRGRATPAVGVALFVTGGEAVKATVYELRFRGHPFGVVHRSFERPATDAAVMTGEQTHPALPPVERAVELPPDCRLVQRSQNGVVAQYQMGDRAVQLEAGEVLALARLGLSGFRLMTADPPPASG